MVLVALLIVVVAATVTASAVSIELARRQLDRDHEIAEQLADASLGAIEGWLEAIASSAVVPPGPDSDVPALMVIDDSWSTELGSGPIQLRVRITAFDQLGMVPWSLASGSQGLGAALPEEVRSAIASARVSDSGTPGLDLIAPSASRSVFPKSASAGVFDPGGGGGGGASGVGVLVATHAVDARRSGTAARSVVLNINTAPRALLEVAAGHAQISLPDALWESRSRGRPFTGTIARGSAGGDSVRFVTQSDCWSFRVDAFAGTARSSWWLVLRRGDRGWDLLQRLPISQEPTE